MNLNKRISSDALITLIRIVFSAIFVFSGVVKLFNINDFSNTIISFSIMYTQLAYYIAIIIPVTEIILGLLLFLKIRQLFTLYSFIILITFFTAIVISKYIEGSEISCGCFGDFSSDKISEWTIIRNLVLLFYAISLIIFINDYKIQNNTIKSSIILHELKRIFILIFLVFISIQNLIFAFQNVELKRRVMMLSNNETLQIGDSVQTLDLITSSNKYSKITYNNYTKTLFFFFRTTCPPCKNNIEKWNSIYLKAKGKKIQIAGITIDSIDATKKYINEHKILYPVYTADRSDIKMNLKIFLTPLTVLINNKNKVKSIWKGELNNTIIKQIEGELL
ncbi:MAG: redoxin domain-containing protein [Bacteroidetes bacterium]|nr:MAG: redoxin domain-containing protein [Bacteroidota bacterium]